jgi:glycosyltransferase involved in cell wall biosynthesis
VPVACDDEDCAISSAQQNQNIGQLLNIVLISGFRVFPSISGGHVRTASIARALSRMGHRVLIYSLAGRRGDYRLSDLFRGWRRVDQIELNLSEETNLGLLFGLLQAIGRRLGYPRVWQHFLLRSGIIPHRLKLALRSADVIFCDMPWCPPIAGAFRGRSWVLISHNLEYRLLEQGPPRHRRFAAWMRAIECAAPSRYQEILACAEEDRDFFRSCDPGGRLRLPIVRNGVDPEAYRAPAGARERVRAELRLEEADTLLVFSGSGFQPNMVALEALRSYCRAESAFLERERVHILALGSMSALPAREGALISTGRVPEVLSYLAAADAGLNPVVGGSGSNVKVFEYLAAKLPVISTTFGVRGTELEPGRDYIPYDPDHPSEAIRQFVHGNSRAEWKLHAERVWARHRHSCDIGELVEAATLQLPQFQNAAS